ncbi:SDR family NAD(P)-dependent oxidoreductase [Mycolicibacterium mageritense]|uniref:SDR family NAD(P)-dependent oxidoreductase n=1 Tax=Mycolicibacterium mageritense TaxID=53462 RepID=UPI001E4A5639|nr:SDR family oxidoreductase [Mycolicibacterium mageritense]GJJ21229.1 3-oxoacyl-ACP reductase [Mycolicibacterium mageritense]
MIDFSLTGKTALVTGANRGLGQAIAVALTELGATVYGTSRTVAGAETIEAALGTPGLILDLTDTTSVTKTAHALSGNIGGRLDILVNNAGINAPAAALDVTEAQWDDVFATNAKGTFFLTRELARTWIAEGTPAAVVNIGSQAGSVGIEERAVYCATKGAVNQLTKVLAIEWAPYGIRVNTVAPTFVRTDLTAATLDRPGWGETLRSRIPLGRFGDAGDVVGAVAFLAGDAARLVTGTTLLVDGGYTAW